MNKITQKMKSQGGASLLIALIFFLTAFMVGTVVLSSAVANSDKMILRREERQRYFALSSAANFLRTTIEGTTGSAWKEQSIYSCIGNSSIIDVTHKKDPSPTYSAEMTMVDGSDAKVQELLAQTAYAMYRKKQNDSEPQPIKTEFSIEAEGMAPVIDVSVTMNREYNLLIELKVHDGEEAMVLTANTVKPVPPPTLAEKDGEPHDHLCNETVIDPITGEMDIIQVKKPFTTRINTYTTEVSWPTVQIAQGVKAP